MNKDEQIQEYEICLSWNFMNFGIKTGDILTSSGIFPSSHKL